MRRQPKWLRALGNTADGVFVVNAAQRIIFWNKGAQKLLGYSQADVLNRHCHEVIAGRLQDKLWCRANCKVHRCVQRGALHPNFDLLTTTKEGQDIGVNVTIIGLPQKGKPLTLHLLRDITRQARREEVIDHILNTFRDYAALKGMREDKSDVVCTRSSSTAASNPLSALTRREVEVLALLAQGLSTNNIADRLAISHLTVRNHIRNTLRKSGLHTRAQAVSLAVKNRLI
ncbi:MAG: LuxR C-terminal-related transcriptional regulator [Terriglobia bacterium]